VGRDRRSRGRKFAGGLGVFVQIRHHAVDADPGVETHVGGGRGGNDGVGPVGEFEVVAERRPRTADGDRSGEVDIAGSEGIAAGDTVAQQIARALVAGPIVSEVLEDRGVNRFPVGV